MYFGCVSRIAAVLGVRSSHNEHVTVTHPALERFMATYGPQASLDLTHVLCITFSFPSSPSVNNLALQMMIRRISPWRWHW
jgi:hypothetical protein